MSMMLAKAPDGWVRVYPDDVPTGPAPTVAVAQSDGTLTLTLQATKQVWQEVDRGTLCGTANEGGTVTITCPAGAEIASVDFVSYGTPSGSCGGFSVGGCHRTKDLSSFVGKTSLSVPATNAEFGGDPCGGTAKRLYVQVTWKKMGWATVADPSVTGFSVEVDGVVSGPHTSPLVLSGLVNDQRYTIRARGIVGMRRTEWSAPVVGTPGRYNAATGGVVTDATRPNGQVWRTHKFAAGSGTFSVQKGSQPFTVILSGGARGGASSACCGSCASAMQSGGTWTSEAVTLAAGDYPVVVGSGGNGGAWPAPCTGGNCSPTAGAVGGNSVFNGQTAFGGGTNGANGPAVTSDIEGVSKQYVALSHGGGCGDHMNGGRGDDGFLYVSYRIG